MTRKSFSEDDFTQSVTLQNVSSNLDLIRRLEHLSLVELGKRTGLSDRHLDSLIRMRSNVSVLALEQIAERLGIPFLTFIGTRLDASIPGGRSGLLDDLRDERKQSPSAVNIEAISEQQLPTGLTPDVTNLLRNLISMQEQLSREQASLTCQVENLTSLIGRELTVVGASSKRATFAKLSDADCTPLPNLPRGQR